MSTFAALTPAGLTQKIIRVIVIDDAIVARTMLARWIDAEPDMRIVAKLATGREALDWIGQNRADVAILDIDMPDLDGISALPLLLQKQRDLLVIMASTLTRRNAEISLRALALGATDYIPKPAVAHEAMTSLSFRRELIEKIRTLSRNWRPRFYPPGGAPPGASQPAETNAAPLRLRPFVNLSPRALVIGASTGGPQALIRLVGKLAAAIDRAPLLVVQHMPPTFTTVLAEHLSRASGRGAHEAEDGEPVLAGGIYVAPGARHMRVVRRTDGIRIIVSDDPPINFCKPAVDALFTSAATVWGGATLALVLSGMGTDGLAGATDIVAAGGNVIAQDQATSVIWGMPGSVAQAGLCSAVLPPEAIATTIIQLFSAADNHHARQ